MPSALQSPDTELEEAAARRDALVDRLAAGGLVKPAEVANADAAVRLAEMRGDGERRRAAQDAEGERASRVAELRSSLKGGRLTSLCDDLADRHRAAVEVLAALVAANAAYNAELRPALQELARLGTPDEGIRLQGQAVIIDGVLWPIPRGTDDARVAVEATAEAVGGIAHVRKAAGRMPGTSKVARALTLHHREDT